MWNVLSVEDFMTGAVSLLITTVLCFLLGVERYYHNKDAGVKTHVLVGMGACLFTLVSIHGFSSTTVPLDPSRLAAQIVSGVGFLGAGVIFVNNDTVKGLTTAATIWISAAIGVACGAGMSLLAVATLIIHYLLIFAIGPLANKIPSTHHLDRTVVEYEAGLGVMRRILVVATSLGYKVMVNSTSVIETENGTGMRAVMKFDGPYPRHTLHERLASLEGVNAVDEVTRAELD
ncbi:MgtC/SapB family protein [Arcanobacterium phocae]|uniref:Putative Mg2+ transporter-C (MgtC) family protein n=1 Tax=Arcanobacterium phocae TaxID=131112 RepID=A0A1H2LH78_9ACTO|nr:MgtC/SapB family protein [Arcanobacterium phocae]SDU79931.1 putative Mg2+ transporter-C (MgtC) family protein [Arcanobacterium phocae]